MKPKKSEKIQKPEIKDFAYYLTLFKIAGHATWRAHLAGQKDGFEKQRENEKKNNVNVPDVTEKQVMRIDRITGTFSQ